MKGVDRSAQEKKKARRTSRVSSTVYGSAESILRAIVLVSVAISVGSTFAIAFFRSKNNDRHSFHGSPLLEKKISTFNENDNGTEFSARRNCQILREAIAADFPEIETVYSDSYLESVVSVPNRTMDHAISKIKRAIECRRSYDVHALSRTFEAVPANETAGNIFVPREIKNSQSIFDPTPRLVKVCASCAFVLLDEELVDSEDSERRLVVYADTSKLNWWEIGVDAGLQYHVLVLEDAFDRITRANFNRKNDNDTKPPLEESIILCVDTTAPPLLPPPLGALRGMVRLLQNAYPDRVHKVYVGPISPLIRGLYANGVRPFLKPKLQQKIILLGKVPSDVLSLSTIRKESRSDS